MAGTFEVVVCRDSAEMASRVATRIADLSRSAARTIALSGGSTPKRLYETLAAAPFVEQVVWSNLTFFFGDERSVPPDHPDSNFRMAHEALLGAVPAEAHRMVAERDEAESYEALLRGCVAIDTDGIPSLDVVLLGMGKDGHTASLFPGTRALSERTRLVVMNEVPQLQTRRMTFTYPLINAAQRVWLLVSGGDKRDLVRDCVALARASRSNPQWPVSAVRPSHGELIWFVDSEAAAGL